MNRLINLEIHDWTGIAIGATHFRGDLHPVHAKWPYKTVKLTRVLTATAAAKINAKMKKLYPGQPDWWEMHDPGDVSEGFETREDVMAEALRVYKEQYPDALALVVGLGANAEPKPALDGPEWFVTEANRLATLKPTRAVLHEWDELVKRLEAE